MRFLDWGSRHHNCQLRLWEFDRLLPGVHGKDVSLLRFMAVVLITMTTTTIIPFQSFGLFIVYSPGVSLGYIVYPIS